MKSDGLSKHVAGALVLAIVIYVGGYSLDQHLRARRGPWRVTFTNESNSAPAIVIDQPALGISNVRIVFSGESAGPASSAVAFAKPQTPVPLGAVKFEDLTYLPGTVTMDLFGHEIELIPRTLFINRQERPWQSNITIVLSRTDKRPLPARPRK